MSTRCLCGNLNRSEPPAPDGRNGILALGCHDDDFTLSDTLLRTLHKFTGSYVCRAISGVDTALWDLRGRRENKSVTNLLGGTKSHVEMYYSSMVRDCPIAWETERIARLRAERGYRAFKLHVGEWNSEGKDYWPGRTEGMIQSTADIVQPDICYIGGFTRTLEMAKRAAALGLYTTPHTSNRSMILYFGLHLNVSIEKPWVSLEHSVEEDKWAQEMFTEELPVMDGKIKVPEYPCHACGTHKHAKTDLLYLHTNQC